MPDNTTQSSGKTILIAWLIVGTADIISAMTWYYVASGNSPLDILVFVGKTALGKEILSASVLSNRGLMCVTGLLVHYLIAFCWTLIFFYAWPKVKLLQGNPILVGMLYGAFIWIVMNLGILPLRNGRFPDTFILKNVFIGAAVLMIAIGMPLAYIIGNYYRKKMAEQ